MRRIIMELIHATIKKSIIKSQHCQRNWDLTQEIPQADLDMLEYAATQCPSKQNIAYYDVQMITNRELIEKIHAATNGFLLNPKSGEYTTNAQVLANLLVVFTLKDYTESLEGQPHRNEEMDAVLEDPNSEKKNILDRDALLSTGVAAGYLNVIATQLGYSTGCCSCFYEDAVKKIIGVENNILLLMGIGFADSKRNRREHHTNSDVIFPTKQKMPINVVYRK